MKSKRRTRQQPAVSRGLLLDATEKLMVAEGYAAVNTRRVASMVGVTAPLVHYYFETTERLLVAAYRRAVERADARCQQALASDRPLHALWSFYSDSGRMALGVEFMAMANHRKVIRVEIARHEDRDRRLQAKALANILANAGVSSKMCTPLSAAMLIGALGRAFVMDGVLGVTCAHAETRAFIERLIGLLESPPSSRARQRRTRAVSRTKP
jgi:AcrR family transcriptional regulator